MAMTEWMLKNTSNIPIYQTFNGYPDSIFDVNVFPYQYIVENEEAGGIIINASPYELFTDRSDVSIPILFFAFLSNDTTEWITGANTYITSGWYPRPEPGTTLLSINFDWYTDNTKTTLYMEKTDINPLSSSGTILYRINI